jgi:hypothetical protein
MYNSITPLWPTNLLYETVAPETSSEFLNDLISVGNTYEQDKVYKDAHVPALMRNTPEASYNLLQNEHPSAQLFKSMLKDRMKQMAEAEGFLNPESVQFEAVCNMRRFGPNEYAKPHNHRSVDYVAVYFLSVGITDKGQNIHQGMAGNRLHLIDPMPMRNRYLNHKMLEAICPVPGTFVIHPAGVFHTTELNLSDQDLIALVTNVKVVDNVRNYEKL